MEIFVEARDNRALGALLCLEEKEVLSSVELWPPTAVDVIAFTNLWTNIGLWTIGLWIIPQKRVKVN